MIRVEVVTTDRSGFILAIDTGDARTAHVVGQVYRASIDGEPEAWKAWLWPAPGQFPVTDRHVDAISARKPADLREALRKRMAARGGWWL